MLDVFVERQRTVLLNDDERFRDVFGELVGHGQLELLGAVGEFHHRRHLVAKALVLQGIWAEVLVEQVDQGGRVFHVRRVDGAVGEGDGCAGVPGGADVVLLVFGRQSNGGIRETSVRTCVDGADGHFRGVVSQRRRSSAFRSEDSEANAANSEQGEESQADIARGTIEGGCDVFHG